MIDAVLGNYRILSKLDAGGMGEVYLGRHETLGHSVALKVLLPELSRDEEMVKRFFNEAQAAISIRNPGIVHIYDFGTTPEGSVYFAMELLDGETLSTRLVKRPPSPEECCRIGRQVANVLHAAHDRGIIHRDLKPANLFLVPDREVMGGERVKVLDFGIAKLIGEVAITGPKTRTGLVMGTPIYMSPEQCRGAGTVDYRTDIYSLGCILFEMAYGRPPFMGAGVGEIVAAHIHVAPPPLSELFPEVPSELVLLIERMLAKEPDDRPQTMEEVSQILDEILGPFGGSAASQSRLIPGKLLTPIPEVSTSSTTLTDGEATSSKPDPGQTSDRSIPPYRRRLSLVIGGTVAAAIMLVTLMIVMRGSRSKDPPAAGSPMDAPPGPTGSAPPIITAIDDIDAAIATPPPTEAEIAAALVDVEKELASQNLIFAETALAKLPPGAKRYQEVKRRYDKAVNDAMDRVVSRLLAAIDPQCKQFAVIMDNARKSYPSQVAAEAARTVHCPPSTDCEEHVQKANGAYQSGSIAESLDFFEAAIQKCQANQDLAQRAFEIACGTGDLARAKRFWKRLSPQARSPADNACSRKGITADQLNAP